MVKILNLFASASLAAILVATAHAEPNLDDWHMIEPAAPATQKVMLTKPHEPLILNQNGVKYASSVFLDNAHANNIASEYIYNTVKGDARLADKSMAELERMGWIRVGHFSALEGKYLNFGDMHSGVVLYNAAQNMYNVVWHGTAGSIKTENGPSTWAGWETNVDNDLIEARQVKSEVIRAIKAEVNSILRSQKTGLAFFNFQQTRTINAFMKALNESLNSTWSADKIQEFSNVFLNTLKAGLNNKAASIVEKIAAAFQVKIDMLRDIERTGFNVDFEGKAHRGFTLKVASAFPQIGKLIKAHSTAKLTPEQKQSARLMNSGHSMGAGLANVFTASMKKQFNKILGTNSKADDNRILLHVLSSPLVGDATFKHDIEKNVGINNIYNQIVKDDFVTLNKPLTYVPDALRSAVENLPVIGKQMATQCDGEYVSHIGTPAIDTANAVYGRRVQMFPEIAPGYMERPVYSHYGIDTGDGRGAHFDSRLSTPLSGEDGYNSQLARGQDALKAF